MENGAERMADELVQVVKCWIAGLGKPPRFEWEKLLGQ